MNMDSKTGAQGELILGGDLNIYAADQLLGVLKNHLQTASSFDLHLGGVESCDPIALQLFISAEKSARAAGKNFRIVAASDAFRNTCNALGLTESPAEIQSLTQP